jgi:hypothetical protein
VGESTRSRSSPTQREEERDSPSPTMNMDDVQLLLRSPESTASKEPATNQWLVSHSNPPIAPQLSHPFPLPNPILYFGIPCALVKLME